MTYPLNELTNFRVRQHQYDPHQTFPLEPLAGRAAAEGRAFPEGVEDVVVLREGGWRVIAPADSLWDDFFDSPGVDLGAREQPKAQTRDAL